METRMSVIEGQEPVDGELRSEIIVLATEHLLAHTCSNLRLEVENSTKSKIATFPALVVLSVLDTSTTTKGVHSSIDIFVQVQTLLGFGHTATSCHERRVEEIGVTIVKLAANIPHQASRESTERLLLSSSQVSKNTNILREDILSGTDDGDGRSPELEMAPLRIRALRGYAALLKFPKDVADLETFLEIVVLISIDEL
jgi:hypothetical protein